MSSNATPACAAVAELDPGRLPRHVAIIMDGNGRWARKRLFNRVKGHEKGAETVRMVVETSRRLKIPYLTLYAFSTENWQRPKTEIMALMSLLRQFLVKERPLLEQHRIRLNVIGQLERLPEDVQRDLRETIAQTAGYQGMCLSLALSYGGRAELVRMVQRIGAEVQAGRIDPGAIDERLVAQHLYTHDLPDPDLLIRTSGEMRISNFLPWQIAYSEICVTDTLWPDFSEAEFIRILSDYGNRQRRFGALPADEELASD